MTGNIDTKPFEILLVEDNPGDVRLTQEALKDVGTETNVKVVGDGDDAMAYLRREGEHAEASRPDMVLLDLNLPGKDGREVLAEIKGDPNLRRIPVVVLTISQAERDVLESYDLHANSYITKPLDQDQFNVVLRQVQAYWRAISRLPTS